MPSNRYSERLPPVAAPPGRELPDGFVEVWRPWNCCRSLRDGGTNLEAHWRHDPDAVFANQRDGTLTAREDRGGLTVEIVLDPGDPVHLEYFGAVASGRVAGASFHFDVLPGGECWTTLPGGVPLRELLDIRVLHVAPIEAGAYAFAEAQAIVVERPGLDALGPIFQQRRLEQLERRRYPSVQDRGRRLQWLTFMHRLTAA